MIVLQSFQTVASLVLPTLNARIVDRGILRHDQAYIRSTGLVMLGFSLAQIVFALAAVYLGAKVAMSFGRDMRSSMFHQVTAFSAREVGTFGAPSLITRITNDVQQVQMLVVMACTMAIAAPITIVVGIIAATRQDLGLSAILAVSVPVAAVVLGVIVARMVPAFKLMQERIDQINRVLREQITGIRVVRAFVREPEERGRFAVANAELTDTSLRAGRLMASMFPTVNLVINASSVAVLWIGASRIQSGQMQIGSLIAYLSYLIQILMSVVMATFVISMIPRASVSAGRIQEVIDTEPTVVSPPNPVAPGRGELEVEFRHVGFHYPGAEHPVLTDISFTTLPGQTTAIVGSTGAGKTTLLQLVPRLFDATEGSVMIGGIDVRALDTAYLWSIVGLVPQKP
ncbi:MAG TPA: ABC transporter ATP-binding protein, partial [Acidimicrobiales bacterium]|nr:ABC transporter ATP-binding protein [Acidimicrobiales bacterium]